MKTYAVFISMNWFKVFNQLIIMLLCGSNLTITQTTTSKESFEFEGFAIIHQKYYIVYITTFPSYLYNSFWPLYEGWLLNEAVNLSSEYLLGGSLQQYTSHLNFKVNVIEA